MWVAIVFFAGVATVGPFDTQDQCKNAIVTMKAEITRKFEATCVRVR